MLEVRVRRRFGAFDFDLSFAANSRGVTCLFGRSGAGKTVLVNMLAGLVRPDAGRIALDGAVLFDSAAGIDLPPERRRLGYVFQEGRLFPHMSVRANLRYGMRRGGEPPIAFEPVVALLGIEHLLDRWPRDLSGGEKQRVAIGRALLAGPRLLLMDEPLAALDNARKAEILPYIERLRDQLGLPIVYVSHAIDEIIRLADTVVLLSNGRVLATGPVEAVMSRLDLGVLAGRAEAGAVLACTVEAQDDAYQLTSLRFGGGLLRVPRIDLPTGTSLRVQVHARDVSIALVPPRDISVLNIFAGRITEIDATPGAQIDLLVDIGVPLWARVTARSRDELGLTPGKAVYTLVKAVAIDRHSLGRPEGRPTGGGNH